MHGLLNLCKPAGVTSRDVVDQVQRLVHPAKAGHAGTLDPLASGVLIVAVGTATRLIEYLQRLPKSYDAAFLLGRRSDTDDTQGRVEVLSDARVPTLAEIETTLPHFIGDILQRPPAFSAVKVNGRRAYDLARRGKPPDLPVRPVTVHSLRIVRYEHPHLELAVECGSGMYVRSLGRDLAESLGTAAVMSQLVRTAIGPFTLAECVDPYSLTAENFTAALLPLEWGVRALPAIEVSDADVASIHRGLAISRPRHGLLRDAAALDLAGNLIAIVVPQDVDHLRPDKVLSSS